MSNIELTQAENGDYEGRALVLAVLDSDGSHMLYPALLSEGIGPTLQQHERDQGRQAVLMPIEFTITAGEIRAALASCPSAQNHPEPSQQKRSKSQW